MIRAAATCLAVTVRKDQIMLSLRQHVTSQDILRIRLVELIERRME